MTGRELIIEILENGLEDYSIVTDVKEAALKCNVGTETLKALIAKGDVKYLELYWIPPEMCTK